MVKRIANSPFWKSLWTTYCSSPSIAFCRVPELEFAAQLDLSGKTLDHCCGDGLFAQLAWPSQQFSAGCDINQKSLNKAAKIGKHKQLDPCDAGKRLPYEDASFDLVFNNSALEHIPDLDGALAELARVTKPGGEFAFNVLNHRYFEWWTQGEDARRDYREWQPFFHALNLAQWSSKLQAVGFEVTTVQGYFPREASQILSFLDFEFSGFFIKKRPSSFVEKYRNWPRIQGWLLERKLAQFEWPTAPDEGAGYFFRCKRA